MSFTDNGLSAADIAAVTGENRGFGGWGDGSFWIIVLFLFALMGNGWNNGGGNGEMQRSFDQQSMMAGIGNISNQLGAIAMNQQNCCCENRSQIADLKYAIATEACADRAAVTNGVRDIIASNTVNTQAILDKLCQQEIDALKSENARLQTQINLSALQASQANQTAQILSDNAAQTFALEQYLNPTPVPAYVVQNPNCCGTTPYNGCGCNG